MLNILGFYRETIGVCVRVYTYTHANLTEQANRLETQGGVEIQDQRQSYGKMP